MATDNVQCTAGDLATTPVETVPVDQSAGSTHTWLADRGYDVAPVEEADSPVGFVTIDELADVPEGPSIRAHTQPITLEEIIATDADFGAVLAALYDQSHYFLGGRNQVTGVLTRADVNTAPARIHLYDRLSQFERAARDLVSDQAPDWKTHPNCDLHEEEKAEIERLHQRAQAANIALAEIHYTQFSTLMQIIAGIEPCWQACGFSKGGAAERALSDVTDLRNAVAHSNPIIQNTGEGLLEGRTIGTVIDAYETTGQGLAALTNEGY